MGLLVEVSIGHRLLSAQEGGTHFRVTVSTSGQQLQENNCASAQCSPRHQGLGTGKLVTTAQQVRGHTASVGHQILLLPEVLQL